MPYYAHISDRGPIRWGTYPFALGVLASPDDERAIGMALPRGWSADRLAVWELHVGGVVLDGRFVIIDAEFVPWKGEFSPRSKWPPE